MAAIIVPTVGLNKARHPELQRFFLACDSTTLAVEIPVWLDEAAILALEAHKGRRLIPYTTDPTTDRPLPRLFTGHIDFIHVRNGALHILDYKPGSRGDRPVVQLTLYALAVSHLFTQVSREFGYPKVHLFEIKCPWFDEFEFNEFYLRTIVDGRTAPPPLSTPRQPNHVQRARLAGCRTNVRPPALLLHGAREWSLSPKASEKSHAWHSAYA